MLEAAISNINILYLPKEGEGVAITTNGIVKKDGKAVMSKGIALEADKLFHISDKLGNYLTQYGNRAFNLGRYQGSNGVFTVMSFPTKHNWKDDSDMTLISKSCEQLVELCDKFKITKCYLPPVGCGCGNLNYATTVRPWISQILDDRFVVILR